MYSKQARRHHDETNMVLCAVLIVSHVFDLLHTGVV